MRYHATVTSVVPCYYKGEVLIEAKSELDARRKIKDMYDKDEIDFDDGKNDYDGAKITEVKFHA